MIHFLKESLSVNSSRVRKRKEGHYLRNLQIILLLQLVYSIFDSHIGLVNAQYSPADPSLTQNQDTIKYSIDSLDPARGPTYGETRVMVRFSPFENIDRYNKNPKCKFNTSITNATFVLCTKDSIEIKESEHTAGKVYLCIQCQDSPQSNNTDRFESVPFTISLNNDFTDNIQAVQYTYYPSPEIDDIIPPYGPKDGETIVDVYGKNFIEYGNHTRCAFGTNSTIARFISPTHLQCISTFSDVVNRAMPFGVSLNNQQFTRSNTSFWYYNWPHIFELVPIEGPWYGGTNITLHGRNFKPFNDSEIDNTNDRYCVFDFKGDKEDTAIMIYKDDPRRIKRKAYIESSTVAYCMSPPTIDDQNYTFVDLSLNNQQYTADQVIFYYYYIPELYDILPREGPVSGNTRIVAVGVNFTDQGDRSNITCNFTKINDTGRYEKIVKGKLLSSSEIECYSPPTDMPGYQNLSVSLITGIYSEPKLYLYYELPIIYSIYPICGPDYGYTQITVIGKNFWDLGSNKMLCVFNKTIFTNATILSPDVMKCDSPTLYNSQGYSQMGKSESWFYYLEVTIDGGKYIGGPQQVFSYYKDPTHLDVVPMSGPIRGGTQVRIVGQGLNHTAACNKTARFATWEILPNNETTFGNMFVSSPAVSIPDSVVVAVALNGQQFSRDLILHLKDEENTFNYYVDPFITYYNPKAGPSVGGTKMKITGYGFTPIRDKNGNIDMDKNEMYVRFVDPVTFVQLAQPYKVNPNEHSDDEIFWYTPALPANTQALMQLSLNGQDWQSIPQSNKPYSFVYYDAPHIDILHPAYGPVKAKKQAYLYIEGRNFICPDVNCTQLKVRFSDINNNTIMAKGEWVNQTFVKCLIPKYTKPDELVVELTLNGQDYTNDGKKYGYFDPYVLNAEPRLISVDGTTKVRIKGFGFVNSSQTKSSFNNPNNQINCQNSDCIKNAQFLDTTSLLTNTFPQAIVNYGNGDNVLWDGINLDAAVYEKDFTDNGVQIWYYQDPDFQGLSPDESPANIESPIFVKTDFKKNPIDRLQKYGNFTCRFLGADGKVMYSKGYMVKYPLEQGKTSNPDSVQCKSPLWDLQDKPYEVVKMDIAVNGQDFKGGFDFTFVQELKLHRVLPMSGPVQGNTTSKLFGLGFKPPKTVVDAKWGVMNTTEITKSEVEWCLFHQQIDYSTDTCDDLLKTEIYDDTRFPFMNENKNFTTIYQQSLQVWNWTKTQGGPYFLEVGKNHTVQYLTTINQSIYNGNITINGTSTAQYTYIQMPQVNNWIYYDYDPNTVYFYFYKDLVVKEMFPHSALLKGGTIIQVSGAWFKDMPWHGVFPHCKFGDKIVRGYFDSTVRIGCAVPPGTIAGEKVPFEVSLNGVDWSNTGFDFTYYDMPLLDRITPTSGKETGGTPIYILGKSNFTKMNQSNEFNCKFTPVNLNLPPKVVPAIWVNETHILCQSVGGWGKGDDMHIQLTFNGYDYDDNNFIFTVFSVSKIYPRSGPFDTPEIEDIIIEGAGFREDYHPMCRLNKTIYNATKFTNNQIRCPMNKVNATEGTVDFAYSPNGVDWTEVEGGFYYYSQPILYAMTPHQGPSQGKGVITFYGKGLQIDSGLQQVQCKVGNSIGKTVYNTNDTMSCVVDNIEYANEGETLPVYVAMNGYTWTDFSEKMYYVPYGIEYVSPNAGAVNSYIDVYIYGKGFMYFADEISAEEAGGIPISYYSEPKCRFGSPDNNAVVDAQIISYDKLLCRLVADFTLLPSTKYPVDIPFSVALSSNDTTSPWTETIHKFRLFTNPTLIASEPSEIDVGTTTEVLVYASEEGGDFFDPLPVNNSGIYSNPMMCQFGRFGQSEAVYINEKVIKCRTPTIEDDPGSIYREEVQITVAMNGRDFDEDNSQVMFTFVGTGTYLVFWQILIMVLLVALIIAALIVCITRLFTNLPVDDQRYGAGHDGQAHVFNIGGGLMVPRGRADWNAERSSVDIIEKASGAALS